MTKASGCCAEINNYFSFFAFRIVNLIRCALLRDIMTTVPQVLTETTPEETQYEGVMATLPSQRLYDEIWAPKPDLGAVREVIRRDPAVLNTVCAQGELTPLHVAARRAHVGLIRALVAEGANLEARTANGETVLLVACQVSDGTLKP